MRNLKKFLALVLAMMMAFSLVITANAKSVEGPFNDESGVIEAFQEGVDVVTGMKIFKGDAGTKDFRPSANIKRSEVAAIVYRLVTGDVDDTQANLYTHVAPFSDVNPTDWFAGYVGYLWNAEIIKGSNTERTEFNPYGEVTGYEALAMVLRAMGYDANDEFTGAGWQIRVGQTAKTSNLLVNVDTTNYGAGHLNAAARRDTVAEIIFQAATKPTVVYTPAFGYQTGNITAGVGVDTRTLGWANFGLTWDWGVVVGNQATGESATKMGIATDGTGATYRSNKNITANSYNYNGIAYNDTTNNVSPATNKVGSVTRSFDHETPLGQFGHANKIWYNGNASSGGAGKYHTYAWFDEVAKTAIVNTAVAQGTPDTLDNVNSALYEAAKAAGFTVKTGTGADADKIITFVSDKYDRLTPLQVLSTETDQRVIDGGDNKNDAQSDQIHLYSLISNSGTNLDVIIALDAEVARIMDTNNTASDTRIVLQNGDNGGPAAGRWDSVEILTSHLTPASVKTLGATVESWVVDGTVKVDAADNEKTIPDEDLDSYYETIAVQQGPSGLVSTIDSEGTITLADGKTIKRSYLYNVVKSGVTQPAGGISAGVSYTFVLDQWGRYLGLSSDPGYTFIYGTFADHSYGDVGSADLNYFVYGVDANGGKIVSNNNLTQLRMGNDAVFTAMDGNQFNSIETARRDYGNTTYGNQVAPGVYRGGVITADGKWYVNDETNAVDYGYNTLDKAVDWTFTSADAARGFVDVSDAGSGVGERLITNNTVFYVVSGTGTSSLNVKTYNGMTAFLDGATQVTIDGGYTEGTDHVKGLTDMTYDVCYMTNQDTYESVSGERPTQNAMVTKVFVYEDAVERNSTTTLYYVHDNSETGLKIAKNTTEYYEYEQYELWQGATKSNLFLTSKPEPDTFYTLQEATTANGIKVYNLVAVTLKGSYNDAVTGGDSRNVCWENQDIDYFSSTDIFTGRIGDTGSNTETVYGLKDAVVVDLTKLSSMHSDSGCGNDHDAHNEIKDVKGLLNAISVGYDVKVSIVNTNSNVSLIYVVHVDNAPIYS